MRLGKGDTPLDESTNETIEEYGLATFHPASEEAVKAILHLDPDLPDGMTRSEWLWIRLPNGDLIFGCYPQDEAYSTFEDE